MSAIKEWGLVMIDDRMIHGQVMFVWMQHKKFNRIIIVDDATAADAFMLDVLRLAAPRGLDIIAYSIKDCVNILNGLSDPQNTMILMKTPHTAKLLYEAGVIYDALNIGGIGSGPGRKNVFKNTAISPAEYGVLMDLHQKGVSITFLSVPGEKSKNFSDIKSIK
ncbi:MAG: PTS sugar transporter subunit IIB [Anaerolineaceae bacterium]|nr:PTS sugar transporter subunit IIB [Anaerolineaceae bacterium]